MLLTAALTKDYIVESVGLCDGNAAENRFACTIVYVFQFCFSCISKLDLPFERLIFFLNYSSINIVSEIIQNSPDDHGRMGKEIWGGGRQFFARQ